MEREQIRQKLEHISELLYQQNIGGAYTELAGVLPGLETMLEAYGEEERTEFASALQTALDAMEQQDLTLLGDVLQYEIMERL